MRNPRCLDASKLVGDLLAVKHKINLTWLWCESYIMYVVYPGSGLLTASKHVLTSRPRYLWLWDSAKGKFDTTIAQTPPAPFQATLTLRPVGKHRTTAAVSARPF